ncbi:hypothetical protein ACFL5O_02205 [Myxococcota bacterium]
MQHPVLFAEVLDDIGPAAVDEPGDSDHEKREEEAVHDGIAGPRGLVERGSEVLG